MKYLSDTDLAERYGVKAPSTIWRWAKAGRLPQPVKLSPGCTRWLAAEVDARDEELKAMRRPRRSAA